MATLKKTATNSLTLTSSPAHTTLGDDVILIANGSYATTGVIDGAGGTDELRFTSTLAGDVLVVGANITHLEVVRIAGGTALDVDATNATSGLSIYGNNGRNAITGTNFNDHIYLSAGTDTLLGRGGDDGFFVSDFSAYNPLSTIDGGGGHDFLVVTGAPTGTLVLGANTFVEAISVETSQAVGMDASALINGALLASFDGSHTLIGTQGDDTFYGQGGADVLSGGPGKDQFNVGNAAAVEELVSLDGGSGMDEVSFYGFDLFLGPKFTNIEVIRIGGGSDHGVDASAAVNGLSIFGSDDDNVIFGSDYADTIMQSAGADELYAGAGDDVFKFTGAADPASVIDGEDGFDTLQLKAPAGVIVLGPATYVERVQLTGSSSSSVDASLVFGETGLEIIGNGGSNAITGTSLDDTIISGDGFDTVTGGAGDDAFLFTTTYYHHIGPVFGGDGIDEIRFDSETPDATLLAVYGVNDVERVVIGDSAGSTPLHLTVVSSDSLFVAGNQGANHFVVVSPSAEIQGYGGNDVFTVYDHFAEQTIAGGDGFDEIRLHSSGELDPARISSIERVSIVNNIGGEYLIVGDGLASLELVGDSTGNEITGNDAGDTFGGGGGADTLHGGSGDDTYLYLSPGELQDGDSISDAGGFDTLLLKGTDLFQIFEVDDLPECIDQIEAAPGYVITIDADLDAGVRLVASSTGTLFEDTQYADTIVGGLSNDVFYCRGGGDDINGAGDSDYYEFQTAAFLAGALIHDGGGSGTDVLRVLSGDVELSASITGIEVFDNWAAASTFSAAALTYGAEFRIDFDGSGGSFTATEFDDTITIFNEAFVHAHGLGGNDSFVLSTSRPPDSTALLSIDGGDGDDQVVIALNGPDQTAYFSSFFTDIEEVLLQATYWGGNLIAAAAQNALTIQGSIYADRVIGTRYGDVILSHNGGDSLNGAAGDDWIGGSIGAADLLVGGAGDDSIVGYDAGDRIQGGSGTDVLIMGGFGLLDLKDAPNTALRGIEVIDLTTGGDDTLKIAFADIKGNLGAGGTLQIDRDPGDTVSMVGVWSNDGSEDGYTTYSKTVNGQTVHLKVQDEAPVGLEFNPTGTEETLIGGDGDDTFNFLDGGVINDGDVYDGGPGYDRLVFQDDGFYMPDNFSNIELAELQGGADLTIGSTQAFAIVAISGDHTVFLGSNAGQSYTGGDDATDIVTLGAAGQTVDLGTGGGAPDQVSVAFNLFAGSTISADGDGAKMHVTGAGSADLTLAAQIEGLSILDYASNTTGVTLTDSGWTVAVGAHNATLVSGDNSGGDDAFTFTTGSWGDRTITIQDFLQGSGNDVLGFDSIMGLGSYYEEVADSGVDAALATTPGGKDYVFDSTNQRLIIDWNQDDAFGAGDFVINLPGVTDLTGGVDITAF